MRTVLRNLSYVVTFDDDARELVDAEILVDGSAISAIGHGWPCGTSTKRSTDGG